MRRRDPRDVGAGGDSRVEVDLPVAVPVGDQVESSTHESWPPVAGTFQSVRAPLPSARATRTDVQQQCGAGPKAKRLPSGLQSPTSLSQQRATWRGARQLAGAAKSAPLLVYATLDPFGDHDTESTSRTRPPAAGITSTR